MNNTKIEWALNPDGTPGYTWNPITGCMNHVNGMCKGGGFPCYAYRLANGRLKQRYLANKNLSTHYAAVWDNTPGRPYSVEDPFYPRFWPGRLKELSPDVITGREKGIFVCDMSDLFGIGVPEEWTRQILNYIKAWPEHRFYLLTKQPQNLAKWSPFPDNCYIGVTITDGDDDNTPLAYMKRVNAKVKFISFEPLLHWWDVATSDMIAKSFKTAGINWLIIGAQTRPYKPPQIEWVREIVEAADKAGIPVFLKDNLAPLFAEGEGYKRLALLRQEVPHVD